MGINIEYMTLLQTLREEKNLGFGSVIEFGAQDISADYQDIASQAKRFKGCMQNIDRIESAPELYKSLGFDTYRAIDASGENGALVFDLNTNIRSNYGFEEKFNLVTNLGTIEHCFDVATAFINMHELCETNGIMIHAFPSAGNANHGLHNFQPRLFALIGQSNNYEVLKFLFTVDYKPELRAFSHTHYKAYDDRDLMCYVVFRKKEDKGFVFPFDSMFDDINKLDGYQSGLNMSEFRSYIKGSWSNVRPSSLKHVPYDVIRSPGIVKGLLKKGYDRIVRFL